MAVRAECLKQTVVTLHIHDSVSLVGGAGVSLQRLLLPTKSERGRFTVVGPGAFVPTPSPITHCRVSIVCSTVEEVSVVMATVSISRVASDFCWSEYC